MALVVAVEVLVEATVEEEGLEEAMEEVVAMAGVAMVVVAVMGEEAMTEMVGAVVEEVSTA